MGVYRKTKRKDGLERQGACPSYHYVKWDEYECELLCCGKWAGLEKGIFKLSLWFYVPLDKSLVLTDFEDLVHKTGD